MLRISSVAFAALVAAVVIATIVDLRTRRIPNLLTGALTGVGLGLAAAGIRAALLFTIEDVERGKPDPEGYLTAARRRGAGVVRAAGRSPRAAGCPDA